MVAKIAEYYFVMKRQSASFILVIIFLIGFQKVSGQTFCNPLNLPRPFIADAPVRLNLADPTVVLFRENYFLFASNAGGYWYSGDLLSWKFVSASNLPPENMAPTSFVLGDWIYFCAAMNGTVFRSKDPVSGQWDVYCTNSALLSVLNDYTVFVDTDNRVFCYYGCSNNDGIMVRELDANNQLNPLGVPMVCQKINPFRKNQKTLKDNSSQPSSPGVTGSWMNKYQGKYFFQCAEQINDQYKYGDVVYVSDNPLGPFTFAANNPFSYRPDGFVSGAGNGSTFTDKYGNWWHVASLLVSAANVTQTALGLFPAGFDKEGNLYTKTDFSDYPVIVPNHKNSNLNKLNPEWALLSDNLKPEASSTLPSFPLTSAFDENCGTYWSAQTGKKGEWLIADLGSECTIQAFQLNFAEHDSKALSTDNLFAYQYLVEYSIDKKTWKVLADKTANTGYETNPYYELKTPVQAQYLKITNYHVPSGTFAISGFRIFGAGSGNKPKKLSTFRALRDYRNPQLIKLSWKKQSNTAGYNIRYGIEKDKLYHSYQVYSRKTRLTVSCPDKNKPYWFQMDAFNENGVTPGKAIEVK